MSISYLLLLLLLLLSRFSRVHQAPPSLGFSRQEHWTGMPFPSPMHESESEVAQSCPTLHNPMDCSPPGSSIHGIFQARILEWGAIAFSEFFASYVKFYILVVISCLVTMFESFVTPWTACSPPASSVHGISQARIQEWVAISYFRGTSQLRDWICASCISGQTLYHHIHMNF